MEQANLVTENSRTDQNGFPRRIESDVSNSTNEHHQAVVPTLPTRQNDLKSSPP